jgi:hypothetical protein
LLPARTEQVGGAAQRLYAQQSRKPNCNAYCAVVGAAEWARGTMLVPSPDKIMSQPNNKARLSIPRDEARKKITDRIAKASEIDVDGIGTGKAFLGALNQEKQWHDYNKDLLATLFTTRRYAEDYAIAAAQHPLSLDNELLFDVNAPLLRNRLRSKIDRQVATLRSFIERLKLIPEGPPPAPDAAVQGEQSLERLIQRFHRVAKQMRSRRQSRPPLEMKDEYDVQYLLHGLLGIFFDDIRDEEWTPSYAGKASRMDFLLPELETVVEAKKTRPSLTAGVLGDELLIDIARYQQHPKCKKLYCFVYDPDGYIANPRGVELDLSKQHGELSVRVMIMPR